LLVVVALGVTLYLPSLDVGFMADDVCQLAILDRPDLFPGLGPFTLYTFADGRKDSMGPVQGNIEPWWAAAGFRQNFLRPLASAVFWLDHLLYGRRPFGFHVSSLVLWGLLLLMVMIFFRSLEDDPQKPTAVWLLAGIFFALDDAHLLNISWIANRYSLLGALFSVTALWLYHLYRSRGSRRSFWLALLSIWLAFLSSEGSLATVAWLVAYELVLGRGKTAGRLLRVIPFVSSAIVFVLLYAASGHGAASSECYLNPIVHPLNFFWKAVTVRLPFLVMGALTPVPAELSFRGIGDGVYWPLGTAWLLAAAAIALLLFYVSKSERARERMMLLGGLISLLPGAASYPHNRMLLLPTVGLAWVLADYVIGSWRCFRAGSPRGHLALWASAILVLVHGVLAPVQAVVGTQMFRHKSHQMLAAALDSELPGPDQAQRARVLLLSTSESGLFIPGLRWAAGLPYPAAVWVVTIGNGEYAFNRTGPNSFEVVVRQGDLFTSPSARVCRDDFRLREGEKFRQGAMRVTIRKVAGGKVKNFLVAIDLPLDNPDVWLVAMQGGRFVRVPGMPWKYPWRHRKR